MSASFPAPVPDAPEFQSIVEGALVGVYVVQDGRLVYANPRLAELFGYTLDDLRALPSIQPLVAPEDWPMVHERLRQRVAGTLETSTHVMRGVRRDGSIVELEVYGRRAEHDGRPAVTGTMIDVTERRARERALEQRERRYRELIENARDIVYTHDLTGRLTSLNRAGQKLLGCSEADACTMRVTDFVPLNQQAAMAALIDRNIRERQDATTELEIITRGGEQRVLEVSTQLIEQDGVPVEIQGIARDVTERRERERALRSLTIVDDLTGLYNRRGFLTLGERHLKLAIRKKTGLFLLFVDLDGLKQINDTFGHLEGDRALIGAAEILRQTFRSADIIARLGGDEFTVFPLEAADWSADLLLSRLDEQLRAYNDAHADRGYRLALSVGVARFEPGTAQSIDQLLEKADQALYEQKRRRR
jgi:diguanylate cyclase (GGDEF)-like protein/PAS domain S-box-containing protein